MAASVISDTMLAIARRSFKVAAGGRFMRRLGQGTFDYVDAIMLAEDLRARGYSDAHVELEGGPGPFALTLAVCRRCRGTGHAGGDLRGRFRCIHCMPRRP